MWRANLRCPEQLNLRKSFTLRGRDGNCFKVAEVRGGRVTPAGETGKIPQRVKIIVQGRTCPPGCGYHLQSWWGTGVEIIGI